MTKPTNAGLPPQGTSPGKSQSSMMPDSSISSVMTIGRQSFGSVLISPVGATTQNTSMTLMTMTTMPTMLLRRLTMRLAPIHDAFHTSDLPLSYSAHTATKAHWECQPSWPLTMRLASWIDTSFPNYVVLVDRTKSIPSDPKSPNSLWKTPMLHTRHWKDCWAIWRSRKL